MVRRYSNFLSLLFLSLACFITVREYKNEHKTHKMYAHLDLPSSVQEITSPTLNDIEQTPSSASIPQLVNSSPAQPQTRTLQFAKGDTIISLLTEAGFSNSEIELIDAAIHKAYKQKKFKPGQTLVINYQTATEQTPLQLLDLEFSFNSSQSIILKRTDQGDYQSTLETYKSEPVLRRVHGKINTSFYSAALKNGVPKQIVNQAITNLTYVMNFQHGIKRGDSFEILYEEHVNRHGNTTKVGNIKYIGFMAGNTYHRIYRMEKNGIAQFYDAKGQSIVRGLLQTPIDPRKMRITSGFCKNRLHPIRGFYRDHKGVDFGAQTGTEIKAAGDGVVVKKGYYGEYGHYIKIKHSGGYETAYGHLSKYASSIAVGKKVSQNEVIGYVGATGNATGPHLHYEVIFKGAHVNPMGVKAMPAVKLVGKDLKLFNKFKNDMETHLVGLSAQNTAHSTLR